MIRTIISLSLGLAMAASAHAQISADVNDAGFIVLSGADELLGVEFTSADGLLVPSADDNAAPFGFLLSNTNTQITFGSLTAISLDGDVVLGAGYAGDIKSGDLVGTWGGAAEGDPIPIRFPTMPPTDGGGTNPDPVIPEPSTGVLALIGLLATGRLRQNRRS